LKLLKEENQNLAAKYEKLQDKHKMKVGDFTQLQERCQVKTAEIQHLQGELKTDLLARSEQKRLGEKCVKQAVEMKALAASKDDLKQKLSKCREELSRKDNDLKKIVGKNRNASNEIKTLKNHLNSNRAIIVEKAMDKDELVNLRTELTTKSTELDDSKEKLKKLSSELSSVLTELKKAQEGKLSSEQENPNKGKYIENDNVKKLQMKLKHKSDEKNLLLIDIKSLKEGNEGLNERVEFYIGQCSEFEVTIKNLNDEISGLQLSIKESNRNYGIQLEALLESKKNSRRQTGVHDIPERSFV